MRVSKLSAHQTIIFLKKEFDLLKKEIIIHTGKMPSFESPFPVIIGAGLTIKEYAL